MVTQKKKIKVKSYSGYRGEETPRSLILEDKNINVVEVIKTWIEEDQVNRRRLRCFHLKGRDGLEHIIYYDEESTEWYYRFREVKEKI